MSMKLEVQGLSYAYDNTPVIENVHLTVGTGEFVGIIGPNGSGKSTLLKSAYGVLKPTEGQILLDGQNIFHIKKRDFAKQVAVVGQENTMPFNFTSREIVAMGRTPHKRLLEPDSWKDSEIVDDAMSKMGILDLAERDFSSLSGGEKQRVLIARALAQKTGFVILDEPTNHLDICFQLQILQVLKELELTVLAAIHDLNLASMFCDKLYVLKDRTVFANGDTDDVITAELIGHVFKVQTHVSVSPFTGKKNIVYVPNKNK